MIGKLGKLPPRQDTRIPQLASYLDRNVLPSIPAHFDWSPAVKDWGTMLNTLLGDCTCAGVGHLLQSWSANAGQEVVLPDEAILELYAAVSGYNPNTGQGDNGAVELDVLDYWHSHGVAGHKIGAYVALELGNHDHVKAACYLFGGIYIGLALPETIKDQRVWSVPSWGPYGPGLPGSLGGHAVPILGYDSLGLTCVTWGATQRLTWEFWSQYCDEGYAILSADWFKADKVAPSGFDLAALQTDLTLLASRIPPTPGPVA